MEQTEADSLLDSWSIIDSGRFDISDPWKQDMGYCSATMSSNLGTTSENNSTPILSPFRFDKLLSTIKKNQTTRNNTCNASSPSKPIYKKNDVQDDETASKKSSIFYENDCAVVTFHTDFEPTNQSTEEESVIVDCNLLYSHDFNNPSNLHGICERNDYSLPLQLDCDMLIQNCTLDRNYITLKQNSSSSNLTKETDSSTLLSRLRKISGSLNDLSTDESIKNTRKFDFTADLDLYEHREKMKTKLMSAWNNMKYGWTIKTKTYFKYDSEIYLLGKLYHVKKEEEDPEYAITRNPLQFTVMELFKRDFTSRIWFTYRKEMPALPMSSLTTDCGWGCMLRCGQMILAQGLLIHFLGRDWRVYHHQTKNERLYHRQIVRWFGDMPCHECPFSLHALVLAGKSTGKKPGDWYGPASVAHILKHALVKASNDLPIFDQVTIYVSQDCTVYLGDIVMLATENNMSASISPNTSTNTDEWKRGVLILIPVRLGGEVLNPAYIPCIKAILTLENCIGIIGGKPRHSMYFIGWQDDKLVYLDPHYCQEVVDVTQRDFRFESYHCMSPRKIHMNKIDPSCTIGFYCRTQDELSTLVHHTKEMTSLCGNYPIFVFSESCDPAVHNNSNQKQHRSYRLTSSSLESDDFVVL